MTSTTDTAGYRVTSSPGPLAWAARALFAFLVTVMAAVALVAAFAFGYARAHDGRVMPGVSVGGVELSGLDRAAAETKLRTSLPSLGAGTVTLRLGDTRRQIDYTTLGRDYDYARMLEPAFAVGRVGGALDQVTDQAQSLMSGARFEPQVRFDRPALDAQIERIAGGLALDPSDASVALVDEDFVVTPSKEGRTVDVAAARAAAADAIDSTRPGNVEVELRSVAIAPRVSTAQLEVAAEAARAMSASDVTLTTGTSTYKLPASVLRGAITIAAQADGSYAPTITRDAISVEVAKLAEPIAASPQNAGFKFANPEGVEIAVVPSRDGRALDLNQTVDRVVAAMERQTQGAPAPTVQLAVAPVHPVFTTAQAQVAKARVKKVSEWSTRYPVGKNNCEGNNITIPTEILDEYVVAPGQTFDFWREIGGIKRELGYCAGAIILGGTTVEPGDIGPDGKPVEGALGGGICSCSTTIFNAALRYGLPMGARKNHYFYISRYPVGLDATVFRSGGKIQTMEFTNDTEWPILIRGVNSPGKVRFELYTVDVGRQVSFSEPEITNEKEASDSIVFTTVGLSPGDVKRSEKPVDGFEVTLYRTVKDKDGKLISRDRFHSRYGTVRGVLLVYGTGEEIVLPPGEPARWPLPGYLQPPPLEAPPLEAPPAD